MLWSGGFTARKLYRVWPARSTISDPGNDILVSAVTAYEVANKFRIGKWTEVMPLATAFDSVVTQEGFLHFPLSARHASVAGLLPGDHRDPFDRLLAAQAIGEQLPLITVDAAFRPFGVEIVW